MKPTYTFHQVGGWQLDPIQGTYKDFGPEHYELRTPEGKVVCKAICGLSEIVLTTSDIMSVQKILGRSLLTAEKYVELKMRLWLLELTELNEPESKLLERLQQL